MIGKFNIGDRVHLNFICLVSDESCCEDYTITQIKQNEDGKEEYIFDNHLDSSDGDILIISMEKI